LTDDTCIICGKTGYKIIGKPRINNAFPLSHTTDYRIVQCRNCSYYFVNPAISLKQDEWKVLYESDYFGKAQKTLWQVELNKKEMKERIDLIMANLGIDKGRFLDMGCGEGYMLKEAAVSGFEPYGVDIAYNLLPKYAERYHFTRGSIFEANFPDNYFSVVYMDSVLEHVPNPVETLSELKRILKPGGIMLVIVPNEDSTMNAMTKFMYYATLQPHKYGKIKPFVTPYHIQGFNKRSLQTLFDRLQLQVISIKGFGGNYPFWKGHKAYSKQYFISLFTYPFGMYSVFTGKQIQLMSILQKSPDN
jgi:2-polyprenyl-3-methyl-5-hydroxy-6-metoxy-1,4-benzoquinol methylase